MNNFQTVEMNKLNRKQQQCGLVFQKIIEDLLPGISSKFST